MIDGISEQELIFAKEYATHGKRGEAAKQAGYSAKSDKALAVAANRLLNRPRVIEAIETFKEKVTAVELEKVEKHQITAEDVNDVVVSRQMLTKRADDIYKAAFKKSNFTASLNALRFMAELHSIVVSETNTVNNNFTLNLLDHDDRSARAKTINGSVSTEAAPDHQAARTL